MRTEGVGKANCYVEGNRGEGFQIGVADKWREGSGSNTALLRKVLTRTKSQLTEEKRSAKLK